MNNAQVSTKTAISPSCKPAGITGVYDSGNIAGTADITYVVANTGTYEPAGIAGICKSGITIVKDLDEAWKSCP